MSRRLKKFAVLVAAVMMGAMMPSFAADWTDSTDSTITYTALKTIKGSGSQYVVTDIVPTLTDIVKMRFKTRNATLDANETLFCSRQGFKNKSFSAMISNKSGTGKLRIDRGNQTEQYSSTALAKNTEYLMTINYGDGSKNTTVTLNGSAFELVGNLDATSDSPTSGLVLFALNNNQVITSGYGGQHYLYYFELYDSSGNLKNCLMPAQRDFDSKVGLYDTKSGQFYPQAGDGTFTTAERTVTGQGAKWIGRGGDNKMSTAANWEVGNVPQEGDDLDFTLAPPLAELVADINATFGKVWLSDGDIPGFTGALAARAVSNLPKMQTYDAGANDFSFTLAAPTGAEFIWNSAGTNWGDADSWTYDNAPATWSDYNHAVFATANATATLADNAIASSVVFRADAAIASGGGTLAVPKIVVSNGVSAVVNAPIDGMFVKSGAGTLTLGASRAATTHILEGTFKMAPGATLSTSYQLQLGTDDPSRPVTFDYGGQSLQKNPADYLVTGSDVTLTNGTFWMSGKMEIRDSAKIPAVLTIAKDATLQQAGDNNNLIASKANGTATVNVVGGTLGKTSGTGHSYLQHDSPDGRLNINVTEGGRLTYCNRLFALCHNLSASPGTNPSLYMMFSDSTFHVGDVFFFGNGDIVSRVPTTPTGVLAATNSTININTTFYIGRNTQDEKSAGSFTADFENCIVSTRWFSVYHDRPLNNARFSNTRFVFRNSGAISTSDGEANWITVGDNGLTLDTQAYTCELRANLGGSGAVEKVGSGTLTVARNQTASAAFTVNEGTLAVNGGVSISRPVAVASGATLKVNATDTVSISSLTPAAGSTLDIASYNGKTPLALTSLTLPADGTVNLTLNGGAFPQGVYAIYAKSGAEAADGDKFSFTTADDLVYSWRVSEDRLLLVVGDINPNAWTGLVGDGRMSTPGNWAGAFVPAAGEDIDFSGIPNNAAIIADADRTFGNVTMGTGVITFANAMAATNYTDTSKIAVAADSTVTLDGDLVFAGGDTIKYIIYTVAEGGVFRVTGKIKLTGSAGNGYLRGSVLDSCPGTIAANGLFNDSDRDSKGSPRFILSKYVDNYHGTWAIGRDGLAGSGGFKVNSNSGSWAKIVAEADFVDSADIHNQGSLVIDAAGYEVTLGTNTLHKYGGIFGGAANGLTTVDGQGKVIVNYNVENLSGVTASRTNAFTVASSATLAFNSGANIGFGALTVQDGGTLEVAESGTVIHKGALTLDSGAALAFNFTKRGVVPQLALAEGQSVVFAEGESTNITVKVLGDVWPMCGEKVLTTCGGFDTEGVSVSLAAGAPKWAKSLSVNDGNIVLDVKPKPMILIVR